MAERDAAKYEALANANKIQRSKIMNDPERNPDFAVHVENVGKVLPEKGAPEEIFGKRWYPQSQPEAARSTAQFSMPSGPRGKQVQVGGSRPGYEISHPDEGMARQGIVQRSGLHGYAQYLADKQTQAYGAAQTVANQRGHGEEFARTGSYPGYERQQPFEHHAHIMEEWGKHATPEDRERLHRYNAVTAHLSPASAGGMKWATNQQATHQQAEDSGFVASPVQRRAGSPTEAYRSTMDVPSKTPEARAAIGSGPLQKTSTENITRGNEALHNVQFSGVKAGESFTEPKKTFGFYNAMDESSRTPAEQAEATKIATTGAQGQKVTATTGRPRSSELRLAADGHNKSTMEGRANTVWKGTGRVTNQPNSDLVPNPGTLAGHEYADKVFEAAHRLPGGAAEQGYTRQAHGAAVWVNRLHQNAEANEAGERKKGKEWEPHTLGSRDVIVSNRDRHTEAERYAGGTSDYAKWKQNGMDWGHETRPTAPPHAGILPKTREQLPSGQYGPVQSGGHRASLQAKAEAAVTAKATKAAKKNANNEDE